MANFITLGSQIHMWACMYAIHRCTVQAAKTVTAHCHTMYSRCPIYQPTYIGSTASPTPCHKAAVYCWQLLPHNTRSTSSRTFYLVTSACFIWSINYTSCALNSSINAVHLQQRDTVCARADDEGMLCMCASL